MKYTLGFVFYLDTIKALLNIYLLKSICFRTELHVVEVVAKNWQNKFPNIWSEFLSRNARVVQIFFLSSWSKLWLRLKPFIRDRQTWNISWSIKLTATAALAAFLGSGDDGSTNDNLSKGWFTVSVTSKKSPNVYKSWQK